jgi:hypothetical protein
MCGQLIFDKGAKAMEQRKNSEFIECCWLCSRATRRTNRKERWQKEKNSHPQPIVENFTQDGSET